MSYVICVVGTMTTGGLLAHPSTDRGYECASNLYNELV